MNIGDLVRYWALWRPDHAAIIHDNVTMNWAEFDARSDAIARGLRAAGVGKGDRVGLLMSNRIEAPLVTIASLKLGAIIVPLNFRLKGVELIPLLEDADCKLVVTEAEHLEQLELASQSLPFTIYAVGTNDARAFSELLIETGPAPYEKVELNDPGFICYTSGTTGQQKGALLTHGGAIFPGLAKNLAEGLTWRDKIMVAVPFVYTGALISCFIQFTVTAGGTMVLESDFDIDRYLHVIEKHRVSIATTVPIIWERLMQSPDFAKADLSSMVSAAAGGASVSVDLIEAYRARGISMIQSYGLTEASGLVASMHSEDAMQRVGWAGRALVGTEIRIADTDGGSLPIGETGEILVKGPHIMREYWRKPKVTAETIVNGWLSTGDLGMMDEHGFLKIMDRSKDMLISGGINVYPAEIERALAVVPNIIEMAVIGVPDNDWGEVPMIIARSNGDRADIVKAIEAEASTSLAKFKRPKSIIFIDEALPRTFSAKVSKPALRQTYPEMPENAERLFAK